MISSKLLVIPRKLKKRVNYWQKKKALKKEYELFLESGKTSDDAFQKLIQLYCASNGKFNEELHQFIINQRRTKKEVPGAEFSDEDKLEQKRINTELNEEGYAVLNSKLSPEICDALKEFAYKVSYDMPGSKTPVMYDPQNPISEIYRLRPSDIIDNEAVQKLIMDLNLIQIAKDYLECEPILDFPAMWWSTSFSKTASAEAAQLYHFDMDRVKWLKVFFYLTDVTEDTGPHCYIAKTHKVNNKPQNLLDRGYVRILDTDLKPVYPKDDFKIITAEKGTIFFGDTKCWHKGQPLNKGDRLVLELQYTSSLFGLNYKINCAKPSIEFENFINSNKVYCSNLNLI